MNPGRLLKMVIDATEPTLARFISQFSSTPTAIAAMMEYDRISRDLFARAERLRSDALHAASLPSELDVRALSHDLDRIKVALAELEARLEELGHDHTQ